MDFMPEKTYDPNGYDPDKHGMADLQRALQAGVFEPIFQGWVNPAVQQRQPDVMGYKDGTIFAWWICDHIREIQQADLRLTEEGQKTFELGKPVPLPLRCPGGEVHWNLWQLLQPKET